MSTHPIDSDPIDEYRNLTIPEVQSLLDDAVTGIELGAYDRRILGWLKKADQPTIVVIASLLRRARELAQ